MGLSYEVVLKHIWGELGLSPPSPSTMDAYHLQEPDSALLSAAVPQQADSAHTVSLTGRVVDGVAASGAIVIAPAAPGCHAPAKRKSTPPPCAHDAATGKLRRLERQETVVRHGACTGCGIVRGRQCAEDWDGRRMCRFCFSQARVTNVYSYSDAAFKEAVQRVSLERRIRQLVQDGHAMLELRVPKRFRRRGKRLALWDEKDLAEETMTLIGTMFRTLWAIEETNDETLSYLSKYLQDALQKYIGC